VGKVEKEASLASRRYSDGGLDPKYHLQTPNFNHIMPCIVLESASRSLLRSFPGPDPEVRGEYPEGHETAEPALRFSAVSSRAA
jgi:hypothetical protein